MLSQQALKECYELAELSKLAYASTAHKVSKRLPDFCDPSFLMDSLVVLGNSGKYFRAIAFKNYKQQIIIALRGTTKNKRDWGVTDRRLWFNGEFPHRIDSRASKFVAMVFAQVEREHPGCEVIFTGHSLGGGLSKIYAIRNNRRAIAYSPISIIHLGHLLGISSIEGITPSSDFSRVINVVTRGEVSTLVQAGLKFEHLQGAKKFKIQVKSQSIDEIIEGLDLLLNPASVASNKWRHFIALSEVDKMLKEKVDEALSETSVLFR